MPRGCGFDSSFATPGPVVSNHTSSLLSSTSSSISTARPSASTFPELLDSSLAINFTRSWNSSSQKPSLSVASGAAADQLPSTIKSDAVMNAASIFLGNPPPFSSFVSIQAFTLRDGALPTSTTGSLGLPRTTSGPTSSSSGTAVDARNSSTVTSVVVVTMKARDDGCGAAYE